MSFEDLRPNWPTQPLTDPDFAADVVDLMVSVGDRRRGTLTVLLCDPNDRYLASVVVQLPPDAIPPDASPAQLCETAIDPIMPALRTAPGTALVLVLGRPGPAQLTDRDSQWAHAGASVCQAGDVRLLGFYVATRDGVAHVDLTAQAAA